MRSLLFTLFSLCLGISVLPARAEQQLYTCGMHPQIIKTEPGDCPICGMKLTPLHAHAENAGDLQVDTATRQRMNLKTAPVAQGPVVREVRAVASVGLNEESLRDVTLKYEAWIERLFVSSTWARVKAGDPLFEVYSPDLYNAELNYVVARRSEGAGGGPLTEAALARLRLLDLPENEISALAASLEVPRTRVQRALGDGVVLERMGVVGQMMKPGERVYRLADLSTVWVTAQINEGDLALVQEGQKARVHLTFGAGRDYEGTVARLLPQLDEQTRTVGARIILDNADASLRPGMFAEVRLEARLSESAVLVPAMAVLRSGELNTVFVAHEEGRFEPRQIRLGQRSAGDQYEVLSGLKAGETVVISGQFMLDSESQLREAILKMMKGEELHEQSASGAPQTSARKEAAMKGDALTQEAKATSDATSALHSIPVPAVLYISPMEEHDDVVSDRPGRCPHCGMKLVVASDPEHRARAERVWRAQQAALAGKSEQNAPAMSVDASEHEQVSPNH